MHQDIRQKHKERRPTHTEPGMLQIITLVLWTASVFIGVLGLCLQSPPAKAPATITPVTELPPQPVVIDVDMTEPPPSDVPPPQQALAVASADVPPLPIVAAPSPMIAFAAPVEGPVRVAGAGYGPIGRAAPVAQPRVQRLTFGSGDGLGLRPDYPPDASAAGEQGVVGVQFTVDESGTPTDVRLVSPSRWPSLNQAAIDTVLGKRYAPGRRRTNQIFFTFKLNET